MIFIEHNASWCRNSIYSKATDIAWENKRSQNTFDSLKMMISDVLLIDFRLCQRLRSRLKMGVSDKFSFLFEISGEWDSLQSEICQLALKYFRSAELAEETEFCKISLFGGYIHIFENYFVNIEFGANSEEEENY